MENLSDKEQIELIKKWWREYGVAVMAAVILGLLLGFGWRYWHQHQLKRTTRASMMYQQLQAAADQNQFNAIKPLASQLMNQYDNTPYAGMAALLWAREAVLQGRSKSALTRLQWVIKNSKMASLKQIARLRAARILLAQKRYQLALNDLKTVDDRVYQPMIYNVQGDIYRAMGKKALAEVSYKKAQSGLEADGLKDPFLNMKLAE